MTASGPMPRSSTIRSAFRTATARGLSCDLSFGRRADGKPAAMITPADGKGWFWLQGAVAANGKLYLFLSQIERSGDGVFGFRQVGATLGVVENPLAEPTEWRIEQKKIPFEDFAGQRFLSYGAGVLSVGDEIYIYGIDETHGGPGVPNKHLVVARVQADPWPIFPRGDFATTATGQTIFARQLM